MPALALVGIPIVITWENTPAFPYDDRINQPEEYQVNLALVSEDETERVILEKDITVSSIMPAEGCYSTEYTFSKEHAGVWKLRIELCRDEKQYNVSENTFEVLLRQPTMFTIGQAIEPPDTADLSIEPVIDEDYEGYFFWSDHTKTLYAVGPETAIITWTDDVGDPLPQVVSNIWPEDEAKIHDHIADSPAVDLLSDGAVLPDGKIPTFVEIRYSGNDASVSGSEFTCPDNKTLDPHTVLLYRETLADESTPYFEIVRTIAWDDPGYLVEHPGWAIGKEIKPDEQEMLDNAHDPNCGSGHLLFEIAPYDPVIYDRSSRTGQIFPVNLDDPCTVEGRSGCIVV